jgi:hypothetical protein
MARTVEAALIAFEKTVDEFGESVQRFEEMTRDVLTKMEAKQ